MALETGQMIAHYRIAEKIGEGGMGRVYRAEDTRLNRDVALKVLPEAFVTDTDRMARFGREAQLLASLNHPNIGAIYGLEESGSLRCLVLELIEGQTLADRIGVGALPLDEALGIARQIAEGLEAAHDKGVIHRDLKPANVVVTPDGTVKILDFGLAKALVGEPGSSTTSMSPTLTTPATHQGMILGTAAYMSPEQAKGHVADRRADIWSFGVVLHEMLAGGRLFASDNVSETLAAVLMKELDLDALPSAVPAVIRNLVARCLKKDPKERLQAIGEARITIDGYRADPTAAAAEGETTVAAAPAAAPRLPWAVAGVLALALGAALWGLLRGGESPSGGVVRLRAEVAPGQALTRDIGASAVLSPDGTMMAYSSSDGSVKKLYLRPLDRMEAVALSGTEDVRAPFFSPDGKWIGFFTGQQLKRVSIAGGAPLALTTTKQNRGGTWSPDGIIVFAPDITAGLARIPETGGEPEPITELSEGERSHRWPSFLPDGVHVLFMAQDHGASYDAATIEVVNVETKERTVLHEGGTYPRYIPTGHLAYVRDGTLFAVPLDLAGLKTIGTPAPLLEDVMTEAGTNTGDGTAHYSFSSDGTLVYLEGALSDRVYGLIWGDRDGQQAPLLSDERPYYSPRLSPDGKHLALQVASDSGTDIWVQDLEREVLTRLTFSGSENILPAWTPDGRRIAFGSTRDAKPGIFWMPADGSGRPEQLWEDGRNQAPGSFSPQGHLAIHVLNPQTSWDLEVIRFEDGTPQEPEPFVATQGIDAFPMFSPDGRWIAYMSDESGRWEIYVRPYPGPGGKWQISTGGGLTPRWSRNGQELLYREGSKWFAVSIDSEGGTLRLGRVELLLEGPYVSLAPFPDYDVTADGERFVLLSGDDNMPVPAFTQLNVILNWFDEVRELAPLGS
jgi:Tol biopolymer transport system component